MNPGGDRLGNSLRFGNRGGRYAEDVGAFYDMLDLCITALQSYTALYSGELLGPAIDGIRYSPTYYAS